MTVAVKVTLTLPVAGNVTTPVCELIAVAFEDVQTTVESNAPTKGNVSVVAASISCGIEKPFATAFALLSSVS